MNKKITLYELLGLVKDGKAPNKVKVGDNYYEYNRWGNDYTDINMISNYWLFKDYLFGSNGNRLNDEVEILDDEDKETKDINISSFDNMQEIGTKLGKAYRQFFEGFSKGWKDTEEDK